MSDLKRWAKSKPIHHQFMAKIPAKVEMRIKDALKRYKPVIEQAKARDIGEADTSTLVKDILADLFGYDKYTEITAEYQIKSTYCDLAIKLEGKLALLIEVKAIGLDLKEGFIKQAVDYAANQGIEWVILTNAVTWQVYKIGFGKPITNDLLMSLNFLTLDPKNASDIESLYLLSREAQGKSLLDEYHEQKQALSKYCIGALLLTEPVLSIVRRELKRLSPDVKIEIEEIYAVISQEVIKREVIEGEKAQEAVKKITRAANKALRAKSEKETEPNQALQTMTIADTSAAAHPPRQL
jgi:predicted type IV restriction endonuclease